MSTTTQTTIKVKPQQSNSNNSGGNKAKPRVSIRLKEALGGAKASKNRSSDLVALTGQYNDLKDQLKLLIAALKNQHAAMRVLHKSRFEVAKQVAAMSVKTPLYDYAGALPSPEQASVLSYASVHATLSQKAAPFCDKYAQFVVNYAVEWYGVLTTRIDAALKTAETHRRDVDHYQKKVEALRQSANTIMSKGKMVDPKLAEKLGRNEEKFLASRTKYERYCGELCALMEEVVTSEGCWKDLHPLLVKLAQFDATLYGEEAKTLQSLHTVVDQLKRVATSHGISPQARLQELKTMQPEVLRVDAATNRLENGYDNHNHSGAVFNSPTAALTTTGSSGSFGITSPMSNDGSLGSPTTSWDSAGRGSLVTRTTNNNNNNPLSHSNSFSSQGSLNNTSQHQQQQRGGGSLTMDMLNVAANSAPPPTMEMLNMDLNGNGGGRHGSTSGSSSISATPLAPMPEVPPPPPPPVSGLSMYSSSGSLPPSSSPPTAAAMAVAHPWSMSSIGSSTSSTTGGFGGATPAAPSYAAPSAPSYAAPPAPTSMYDPFGGSSMAAPAAPVSTNPFHR